MTSISRLGPALILTLAAALPANAQLSRTERAVLRFADGFQDRVRGHLDRMENPEVGNDMEFAVAAE